MRRFAFRHLSLAFSLILISIAVSGCFQTAGASLEATPVGNQPPPATPTLVPPTQAPETPPPVGVTPTTNAAVAGQPTTGQEQSPTQPPTQEPPTQAQLPPPTEEPTQVPPTEAPPPTQPEPTQAPPPTATLGVEVAQAATATLRPNQPLAGGPQGTQTAVQGTLFAQATEIIAGVTQTAAVDLTSTATAQGTFEGGGQQPAGATPTLGTGGAIVPTLAPGAPQTPGGATLAPQGTPGAAGSGAAGPIAADCTYTVVEGDRLLRIALRFNTTPQVLARLNGIVNMDLVIPGQKIRVPNCFGTPVPGTTATLGGTPTFGTGGAATPVAGGGGNRVHLVVDGDTLYGIATRYGSKVMAIAQANGIANINLIYIGQRLVIP